MDEGGAARALIGSIVPAQVEVQVRQAPGPAFRSGLGAAGVGAVSAERDQGALPAEGFAQQGVVVVQRGDHRGGGIELAAELGVLAGLFSQFRAEPGRGP